MLSHPSRTLYVPQTALGRSAFALVILIALLHIGRNLYQQRLNTQLVAAVQAHDVTAVEALLERMPIHDQRVLVSPRRDALPLLFLAIHAPAFSSQAGSGFAFRPSGLTMPPFALPPAFPLDTASERIAYLLIQKGTPRQLSAPAAYPYLIASCDLGSVALLRCLLEKGADANLHDGKMCLPLIEAALAGQTETVRLLYCWHMAQTYTPGRSTSIQLCIWRTSTIMPTSWRSFIPLDTRFVATIRKRGEY